MHVAVKLQLLEMSSITTPNHVCTRYNILRAIFYEKYWRFLPICHNQKFSTVIACKQNRFDFWNSCKGLQNRFPIDAVTLPRLLLRYIDSPMYCYIPTVYPSHVYYIYALHSFQAFFMNTCTLKLAPYQL